ncbi:MAG: 30S ribosomal protein S1 [Spirochaetales bacterium]|nr:30S ribosomal protein S1 [Spirochaetales bacterium]
MSENKPLTTDEQTTLQEEYLKSLEELEEGQLIDGEIIEINSEHVFIDVGYKSEGKIPLNEFDEKPVKGTTVSVILVSKEGKHGEVIVSKRKADMRLFWKTLRKAHQENLPVAGTICKSIKGGFEVDLGFDVRGFLPLSKTDVVRVEDPESYVGLKGEFLLDRMYSDNKLKIVLSRRGYLEQEISRKKEDFFTNAQVGDEIEGVVKSFTSFGAFIDLGGFDGLLHINDMSWGHVVRPKDYVKRGEKIRLKIVKIDPEEQKINLSLKHFTPDPWMLFEQKYHVNDIVHGKVTKLTDFGAFIEIEEGIEGLAHISELSWVKRVKHPKDLLSVGDEVEAMILSYELEKGRVSLGLKQVYPNPWENIEEMYPVGRRLKKPVRKLTNAGAFIELEEGIEGFLHVDDISWTRRIKHPSSILKANEDVEVVVLAIDQENRRVRLGIKQLSDDPWKAFEETYPKGSVVEGEITNVTDFGVFIRVDFDIEGLINKYNLYAPGVDAPEDFSGDFHVGDKVKAVLTDINAQGQKLSFSIKEYQKNLQRSELSKYIHDDDDSSTVTLGDMLKQKEQDSD